MSKKPYCDLDPERKLIIKLAEKKQLTHNTYLYRLKLLPGKKSIHIPIGLHIKIHLESDDGVVERKYTPISLNHEEGFLDLAIRVYFPNTDHPDGGVLTQLLHKLELGEDVPVTGPHGKIEYHGHGKFTIDGDKTLSIDAVTMIAGGTGISPMFRIIRYIHYLENDRTRISLIYVNRSAKDIMLHDELNKLEAQMGEDRLKVTHVISAPSPDWKGGVGRVTEQTITEHAHNGGDKILGLVCGRPVINKAMVDLLLHAGYPEANIYCF